MSGYDNETGIFELNWSKAIRYFERRFTDKVSDVPMDIEKAIEHIITSSPFTYLGKNLYGFKLVADDAQIFELLSEEKATWGHSDTNPEDIYQKWRESRVWLNATDLGKELSPKSGAVKVNKILELKGYIERKDGGWVPTVKSIEKDLVVERGSSGAFGNKPCVLLHKNLSTIIDKYR